MRPRGQTWNELADRLRVLRACADGEVLGAAVLDVQALAHELRVQQLELEMQNRHLRAAHQALEASREHYALLYDFAPVGYVTLDPCGRIEEMNLTAVTMLGAEREQLLGQPLAGALGVEDVGELQAHLGACLRERHSQTLEVRARPPGHGQQVVLQLTSTPISRACGGDRCLTIVADVTEARKIEQQREDLLERARQAAEEASRLKDEFLGIVSHELRTPLTAVLGWSSMLCNQAVTDPQVVPRGLEVLRRNAEALARIVDDILDVSRIVKGKLRVELAPVHMDCVVQAALDAVRPAAEAKRVALAASVHVDCEVMGDAERLRQVVWNLLSNAIKFSRDDGTGRVDVIATCQDDAVRLTVSDNGSGIEAEHLPYVFDRFRQFDHPTARTHSGLGLGLAIVRHIVEAHGGSVVADSAGPGRGANFTIDLPRRATPSPLTIVDAAGMMSA